MKILKTFILVASLFAIACAAIFQAFMLLIGALFPPKSLTTRNLSVDL